MRKLLGVLLIFAACSRHEETAEEPILLKIGNEKATFETFNFFLEKGYPEVIGQSDPEMLSFVFDQFMEAERIYGYAEALGLRVTNDEIDSFIHERLTHLTFNLLPIEEQVLWQIEIRRRLTIQKFLNREIVQNVSIEDSAIEDYFHANPERFNIPQKYRFRVVECESKEQGETFLKALKSTNKTFVELAAEYAVHDGYLMASNLQAEELPKPFRDALARLQPGKPSKVIELSFADLETYHVLFLENVTESIEVKLEDVFDTIKTELEQKAARNLLKSKLESMEKRLPMEVYFDRLPFSYVSEENRGESP